MIIKVYAYINSRHYLTIAYMGDGYQMFDVSCLCRLVRPAEIGPGSVELVKYNTDDDTCSMRSVCDLLL